MNWCASNCVNSETAPCSECKNSYQHKVDCSKYNLCYQCRQLEPKPEGKKWGDMEVNIEDVVKPGMIVKGRHPMAQRFHEILQEIGDLHDKKQEDYGRDKDPFANVRSSQEWGIEPWVGAMVRLNDKVKRLQKAASGKELANESVIDSLNDIAVYAMISRVLYEEYVKERATKGTR